MRRPRHDPTGFKMSFGDHLDELRRRVLLALAAPLPVFIVLFLLSDTLIEWMLLPVFRVLHQHGLPADLQVLSPPEFLLTKLKLSLITAIVLTAPWIIWQAWRFVAPGLYAHERRFVYLLLPGSVVLTAAGLALLYFVMLPLMLHVLIMFAKNVEFDVGPPDLDPRIQAALESGRDIALLAAEPEALAEGDLWLLWPRMELYIALQDEEGVLAAVPVPPPAARSIDQAFRVSFVVNFTLVLMLGVVIAFQMPLVIVLLGWMDLASAEWLSARRGYALALCGVVAAVITPADAASMLIMLVPLYGLYELGIVLLRLAPASAVAEGTVFRRRAAARPADNPPSSSDERPTPAEKPAQSAASVPRIAPTAESDAPEDDAGGDR